MGHKRFGGCGYLGRERDGLQGLQVVQGVVDELGDGLGVHDGFVNPDKVDVGRGDGLDGVVLHKLGGLMGPLGNLQGREDLGVAAAGGDGDTTLQLLMVDGNVLYLLVVNWGVGLMRMVNGWLVDRSKAPRMVNVEVFLVGNNWQVGLVVRESRAVVGVVRDGRWVVGMMWDGGRMMGVVRQRAGMVGLVGRQFWLAGKGLHVVR